MKSAIACRSTGRTCIQKAEKGHNTRMTRRGKQRVWVHLGRQQEKFEQKIFGFIKYIFNEKNRMQQDSALNFYGQSGFRDRLLLSDSKHRLCIFFFSFFFFFLPVTCMRAVSTFCGLNCNFYSCTLCFVAKYTCLLQLTLAQRLTAFRAETVSFICLLSCLVAGITKGHPTKIQFKTT